jgi:phage/plasmid primase-like uncharacterized protein
MDTGDEEIQEDDEGVFEFKTVGEAGSLKAVLILHCPECGKTTRFTAKDEDANGEVRCPCGETTIVLEGDGLRGGQRKLDEANRAVKDLEDTFKNFGR